MLQANSPDTGSATDELEVDYSGEELSIGFNSRYLLDLSSQIGILANISYPEIFRTISL